MASNAAAMTPAASGGASRRRPPFAIRSTRTPANSCGIPSAEPTGCGRIAGSGLESRSESISADAAEVTASAAALSKKQAAA